MSGKTNPDLCHGRLGVEVTRVMSSLILDNVGAGESFGDVMKGYDVEKAGIEACLLSALEPAEMNRQHSKDASKASRRNSDNLVLEL